MPDVTTFSTLAPYHIIAYGTLLGSEIFQSFIGGVAAFRALPRPSFATLQSAIFPIYFGMQTVLPPILALTYPGSGVNRVAGVSVDSGLSGVLSERNRLSVLVPLGTMFATGLANWVYFGPQTTAVMKQRKHQETRDGKKSYDPPPHSKEMLALNKQFGQLHGVSTMVNLAGLLATIYYGGTLADMVLGRH